jgi:hypothetical protein
MDRFLRFPLQQLAIFIHANAAAARSRDQSSQ